MATAAPLYATKDHSQLTLRSGHTRSPLQSIDFVIFTDPKTGFPSPKMESSRTVSLPAEDWSHVLTYLSTRNIKNIRLVNRMLDSEATRTLFSIITVAPTIESLRKLRKLTSKRSGSLPLCECVREVEFDLYPLWKVSHTDRQVREAEERTFGTLADYIANHWSGLVHFGV